MSTQTWFITGASSGLGASVANAALRAGHCVAVTARDKVRLEKLYSPEAAAVVHSALEAKIPQRRRGSTDEIARVVLFLACDDSSFMTGEEVVVDGGMTRV